MSEFYSLCQILVGCGFSHSDQNFKHGWELRRKMKQLLYIKKKKKKYPEQLLRDNILHFDLEAIKLLLMKYYNIRQYVTKQNQQKN